MNVYGYITPDGREGCIRARTKEDAIERLKFLNIKGEIK